jgi:hypothetical protein
MTLEQAQELQMNVAKEAVALMVLFGSDAQVQGYEDSVVQIGKVWNIPQEQTEECTKLLQAEKEAIELPEKRDDVLPESKLPINISGWEVMRRIWGLFETAIQMDSKRDREKMQALAVEIAEIHSLEDWFEK